MKTTTVTKIKAGRYIYRGVTISKHNRLGFTFIASPKLGDWYYGSIGTLARAKANIDQMLDSGQFIAESNWVKEI